MKQQQNIRHNDGLVLFISLVFLLVTTILAISSLQSNLLNEKMTRNTIQREQALEAAEFALLEGEEFVQTYAKQIASAAVTNSDAVNNGVDTREASDEGTTCTISIDGQGGICTPKDVTATTRSNLDHWIDVTNATTATGLSLNAWSTPSRHRTVNDIIKNKYDLNITPKYIVEFMGYSPTTSSIAGNEATSDCTGASGTANDSAQLDNWPYCNLDPLKFRITTLATSGNYDEIRVMLQSTYIVDQ